MYFDAHYEQDGVLVQWSTASQVNNDYFDVQKSIDGYEWKDGVRMPGAGNSNSQIDYSWFDASPSWGVSYYRLKQTDYDGKSEVFQPVSVFVAREEPILIKRCTILGQDVWDGYRGIVIEYYSDGTFRKRIQ